MATSQQAVELLHLGVSKKAAGDLDGAVAAYRDALALSPSWPEAHFNLAAALLASGQADAAVSACRTALELRSGWAEAYNSLGVALQKMQDHPAAMRAYETAAELRPDWNLPCHNLARAAVAAHEWNRAIEWFRTSIARAPEFAPSHLELALQLLQQGRFEEGLREFEWRWDCRGETPSCTSSGAPLWNGAPLNGKVLLLWWERGLGDIIQFVRYASLIPKAGGQVWLQAPPPLAALMQTCPGIDRVVEEAPNDIDFQLPLLSLPRVLGATFQCIPRRVPYLSTSATPPALDRIRPGAGLKVGILWASGSRYPNHWLRDCNPEDFRPLAALPGVQLYSLQFGERARELQRCADLNVVDLSAVLGDFHTTAAFVWRLDLVITVDTAMAHLAGALGRPVWTLLSFDSDWRWFLNRADSPWYPTMRLFRQPARSDWDSVFHSVVGQAFSLSI